MAARELKARERRMDGGLLSGWARRLFRGKSLQRDPGDILRDRHTGQVRALPGGRSRRWSCCASCTPGLQRIKPGMDIGVDLGEEWGMAVAEIRIIMVAFRQSFDTSTFERNYIQRRKSISLRLKAHPHNESRPTPRSSGAAVAATRLDGLIMPSPSGKPEGSTA